MQQSTRQLPLQLGKRKLRANCFATIATIVSQKLCDIGVSLLHLLFDADHVRVLQAEQWSRLRQNSLLRALITTIIRKRLVSRKICIQKIVSYEDNKKSASCSTIFDSSSIDWIVPKISFLILSSPHYKHKMENILLQLQAIC
jgi:hypothetical protein